MKKQLIDQTAHFVVGVAVLLPAAAAPGPWSFALAGAGLGLIREITEEGPITNKGSILDIVFWALGGVGAFFLSTVLP